jgi:hypothetical protein
METEVVLRGISVLETCTLKQSAFSYVRDNLISNYEVFNPTVAQSTTHNPLPLYDVPPTRFDFNMAILREVFDEGLRYRQSALQKCILGVKNEMYSHDISKSV